MDGTSRSRPLARALVATLALAAGLLVAASTAPSADGAGEPGQYYDGLIKYSQVLNCPSVIGGYPYFENGTAAYVGAYMDPDDGVPAVNQTFYIRVTVFALGTPCAGQLFVPSLGLPANVSFDTNEPIVCLNSINPNWQPCGVQWANMSTSAPYGGTHMFRAGTQNGTWTLGRGGSWWEFYFPVRGSAPVTSGQLRGFVKMFDGNSSPVLQPTSNMYVFGAAPQPAVFYDSPSTVAAPNMPAAAGGQPTAYGLYSYGSVFTNGAPGVVHLDFGTTATNLVPRPAGGVPVNNTGATWNIWTDWNEAGFGPLQPGTTYRWRLRFDPTAAGPDTVGALQSFTVPSAETCKGQNVTVSMGLGQVPTEGNDVILGTAGADAINALGGNDVVCAGGGNDNVDGGAGNDTIDGEAGRDNLIGGANDDTILGNAGIDTVSYAGNGAGVVVNLAQTTAQNTVGAGTDTITGVENATGSANADTLVGTTAANRLDGGAGGDTLTGGGGVDTVSYAGNATRVVVSLSLTAAQNTQGSGLDRITQVENLVGTSKGDQLTGNAQANRLDGGAGSDRCDGKAGRDTQVACETRISIP